MGKGEAAILGLVQVEGDFLLLDLDCFNNLPPCVVNFNLLDCGSFPVHPMLCLPCVYCFESYLFTAPLCSLSPFSSFSDVHAVAVRHVLFVYPSHRHELQVGGLRFAPAHMTELEGELGANSNALAFDFGCNGFGQVMSAARMLEQNGLIFS